MTELCKMCQKRHNPDRPHCPNCGQAMVQQQKNRIFGWGCGNQWHNGCCFWMPDEPRRSKDGGLQERNYCLKCHGFVPHHFWIYDEKKECGNQRLGDWFCVKHFGPLPIGRENVQKRTPRTLSSPAHL